MFSVIEGGRESSSAKLETGLLGSVDQEAHRRLRAAGSEKYEARERLAGLPLPNAYKHFKLQIEYTITALMRTDPSSVDFTNDKYWPVWNGNDTS